MTPNEISEAIALWPGKFLTCDPCERGMPELWPECVQAWEVWRRVLDQFSLITVERDQGGKKYTVYQRDRFMHEALWPIINAIAPPDPLHLFDQVTTIAEIYADAWRKRGR